MPMNIYQIGRKDASAAIKTEYFLHLLIGRSE